MHEFWLLLAIDYYILADSTNSRAYATVLGLSLERL